MSLTKRDAVLAVLGCTMAAAVGAFLLYGAYEGWLRQELLLKGRRVVPRLITYAANPTEFALRHVFLAALGGALFSAGAIPLLGLLLRPVLVRGAIGRKFAFVSLVLPLACFLVWFALLFFLPFYYD
jgi:hypothetical protein